jgi:hypothetical protein
VRIGQFILTRRGRPNTRRANPQLRFDPHPSARHDDGLEVLSAQCDGEPGGSLTAPFPAVTPGSFQFPEGDSAQVEYYEDGNSDNSEFGFLKVTIEARTWQTWRRLLQRDLDGVRDTSSSLWRIFPRR